MLVIACDMKVAQTILLLIVLPAAGAVGQINSNTIASWTFESNPLTNPVTNSSLGPISPESGQGEIRGFHANSTTEWNTSDSGNGSSRGLSANRWASGDYFEFRVQKTDPNDTVAVTWHQRRSGTAPQQFSLRYSTNGTNFSLLTNYTPATNSWRTGSVEPTNIYTYELTNLSALTNNPLNLTFRIVADTNASNTAGVSRIDNVSFVSFKNRYFATIAGQRVQIERWGSGPTGVILFSHTGSIANTFKANSALVQTLVGTNYSVFTWEYPDVAPFSQKWNTLGNWLGGVLPPQDRLLFPGVASSLLAQIRQATGLQQFILVGNSMGAGVVLSDYDTLVQDPGCTMLLISPTEPFLPITLPNHLRKTLLVSDCYSVEEEWLRRDEDRQFLFRNSTLPLPNYPLSPWQEEWGHIIISDTNSISYAFSLLGYAMMPPGSFVTVTPRSGERLFGNSIVRLAWFAAFGPDQVKLELLKDGQPVTTIAESTFNSGRYDWKVPPYLADGTNYSLRVSSLSTPSQSGGDDVRFAIQTIPIGNAVGLSGVTWETGSYAQYKDLNYDVNVDGNTNPAGGILDISKVEVVDTAEDVIFTMTVNGNVSSPDWGKYMIGIANQKSLGTVDGNPWLRPISLSARGGYGMTHWVGAWVNGGGGAEIYSHQTTGWSGPTPLKAFAFSAGAQTSTLTYTISKQSLGVTNGETIKFDAYSSGAYITDGAIDALANTNVSANTWGGAYTSDERSTNTRTYTLANTALVTKQWFGQTANTSDGFNALQSGRISHNEASYLQATLQGPGTLTFDLAVSSESAPQKGDWLRFSILGYSLGFSSPAISWTKKATFSIPAGQIPVRWTFERDNETTMAWSGVLNAGWVDNITFVPSAVDGIPSSWWIQYFGTTDGVSATADTDGDGFTNAQEYALGTIPTDASSTFRVRSASLQSGTVTISWDAVAGKTYQLVAKSSLSSGDWQPVGEPLTASASGPVSRSETPSTPSRFYRVTLVP